MVRFCDILVLLPVCFAILIIFTSFSHEFQALVDGRIRMVTNMRETLILTPDMDKESTDGRTAMSTVETLIVSVFKCTVIHLCVEN